MLGTTILYVLSLLPYSASYDLVREYSGLTFFDRWDFYGSWDNLTHGAVIRTSVLLSSLSPLTVIGDVVWVDRDTAFQQNLAYVDEQDRVIIKVDNTNNVPWNEKRNSVFCHCRCFGPEQTPKLKNTMADSNHFARLLQCWKPLDYRLDAYTLRVFGTCLLLASRCQRKVNHRIVTRRFGRPFGVKGHIGRIMVKLTSSKVSTSW